MIALIERNGINFTKQLVQASKKSYGLTTIDKEKERWEKLSKDAETKKEKRLSNVNNAKSFEEIYRLLPLPLRYNLRVSKAQKTKTHEERESLQNRETSFSAKNKFLIPDLKYLHIPQKLCETRYPPYLALSPAEQLVFCALLSSSEQRYYGHILNVLPNNEKAVLELQKCLIKHLKKFALKQLKNNRKV